MSAVGREVGCGTTQQRLRAAMAASEAINNAQASASEQINTGGAAMASSFLAVKAGLWVVGAGALAGALGFIVLPPRTLREFAGRMAAAIVGSALVGPLIVVGAYLQWPDLFQGAMRFTTMAGLGPWFGLVATAAPMLALAGLPFWWIVGAVLLWFDRRKGKDIGELGRDARHDVAGIVREPGK